MSDSKLLNIYLDFISGRISYGPGGIIYLEYPGDSDIFESYADLIANVKYNLKELKKEGAEL